MLPFTIKGLAYKLKAKIEEATSVRPFFQILSQAFPSKLNITSAVYESFMFTLSTLRCQFSVSSNLYKVHVYRLESTTIQDKLLECWQA